MNMRRCQPAEAIEVQKWIASHHYLRSTPPSAVAVLEFLGFIANVPGACIERLGAMMVGRPTSKAYDPKYVMELTRMFFVDEAPKNTESRGLATMRKHVRNWHPEIRLLIAYADPSNGHEGIVYLADGWAPFGRTKEHREGGWKSRGLRRCDTPTSKIRFVRTP